MIEAVIGIPGAGKSFFGVKRSLDYLARGGAVFTNIRFTGLVETGRSGMDKYELSPESPCVQYLKRELRWQYVGGREDNSGDLPGRYLPGQYHYLNLTEWDESFLGLIPRGSPTKRILLILDEVNEWFDSLDGGKLKKDEAYRETMKFLRLSRHYHIDVVFLLQDFSTLNARLRGLCATIWKCTDMQKLRVAGVPFPFPFKWFMWQQWDGKGKHCLKTITWPKEQALFKCYDSFCEFGSVSLNGGGFDSDFTGKGRVSSKSEVRKMTWFDRVAVLGGLLCIYLVTRSGAQAQAATRVSCVTVTNTVSVASSSLHADRESKKESGPDRLFPVSVRYAHLSYGCAGAQAWAYADGKMYRVGQRHPEGLVVAVEKDFVRIVGDEGFETFIYPLEVNSGEVERTVDHRSVVRSSLMD